MHFAFAMSATARDWNTSYGVLMGTGLSVKGEGTCKGVVLTLQNIEIVGDL